MRKEQSEHVTAVASLALCMTILVLPGTSHGADNWTTLIDEQNLTLQSRPYSGSALQEIRGTTHLKTSLNAVMALLKDAPFNSQWVYRSGGAKILAEDGYTSAYVYGIVDAPWPMQDRDTVVRFDYQQADSGEITIDIINFPAYLPPEPGYVRVPDFGGFWQLRPISADCIEVVYQVYGDPGGWIPVWIANLAAQASVERTLKNMPSAVARYRNAHSDHVRETPAQNTKGTACENTRTGS